MIKNFACYFFLFQFINLQTLIIFLIIFMIAIEWLLFRRFFTLRRLFLFKQIIFLYRCIIIWVFFRVWIIINYLLFKYLVIYSSNLNQLPARGRAPLDAVVDGGRIFDVAFLLASNDDDNDDGDEFGASTCSVTITGRGSEDWPWNQHNQSSEERMSICRHIGNCFVVVVLYAHP